MLRRVGLLMAGPLVALAVLGWVGQAGEASAQGRGDDLPKGGMTAETEKAIAAGLAYLAKQQANDGSWGTGQFQGNVAITSLAGLAFLSGGHQAGRGRYGKVVSKAIEYILKQEDQQNSPGYFGGRRGNLHGPMYNHGFATLFLAEVHGMMPGREGKDRVKEALERAVKLIIKSQNQQGGWRYMPQPNDADISVTICQIMALRAARNAGVTVPKGVADKCTQYVKSCQDPNSGGFHYQPHLGSAGFARTAAGVVALHSAGIYNDKSVEKGLDYLMRMKPGGRQDVNDQEGRIHYYYGHYYAAQAMWTKGGKAWKEWFPAIRDELLRRFPQGHRQNDHWSDGVFCPHYSTAMALIILQIPNNYLPILQK